MASEQEKQILGQAQTYQQQLQGIMGQKENMKLQSLEIGKAVEELGKTKETDVYKISGPILLKSKKADVLKELKEKQEFLSAQLKTLEKSEERLKSKLEELKGKLQSKEAAS